MLAALLVRPQRWRHGYDLARETDLKSGTLYPLLIRLSEHGLLESEWQAERGGAPRHAYRLTPAGLAVANRQAISVSATSRAAKPARAIG